MLKHVPHVDRLVFGDPLRRLEREATSEDTEATEDDLLGFAEQTVTPLERGAQRLVPAQDRSCTAREHLGTLLQARPHAFDPEQW